MPTQTFETCELHANGAVATHLADFGDGNPAFLVCPSCSDDAAEHGAVVSPLPMGSTGASA